ncbi:MAG TPA: hypothetical protein DD727_08125 [Clostridiales bacterium]|nr:hypothetical protein [Clostridiales bacterium]
MSKRKLYYITLFTSVFIVSAATILLYRAGIPTPGDVEFAGNLTPRQESEWTMQAFTGEAVIAGDADGQETTAAVEQNEEDYITPVVQDTAAPAEGIETLIGLAEPVFGQVVLEYAMDRMVYSRTLDEWRTHPGLDIGCELGQAVTASADGTVVDVYEDARLGVTVVVEHANHFRTVYANLTREVAVLPNMVLSRGDVIGYAGNTARIESIDPVHLHYEVHYMGQPVDPARFMDVTRAASSDDFE